MEETVQLSDVQFVFSVWSIVNWIMSAPSAFISPFKELIQTFQLSSIKGRGDAREEQRRGRAGHSSYYTNYPPELKSPAALLFVSA